MGRQMQPHKSNQPRSDFRIKEEKGLFKVYDKQQRFRVSFATQNAARAYIAAQELRSHKAARQAAGVLALLLVLVLGGTAPAQAGPVRPRVSVCRVHNGKTYCLPTAGGSGITPPIIQR